MRKRKRIKNFLIGIFLIGKKAAPRFELGIKDLQSSALPLGHAAKRVIQSTPLDRISQKNKIVLVLSNGHGEDLIALRILEALHQLKPDLKLEVLPLVGEGRIFSDAIKEDWLIKRGISKRLPSGGFSNQSFSGLFADIFSGFLVIAFRNWLSVRSAVRKGRFVFAVGDLLPLLFAWTSGGFYGFLGTPKSDYTWLSNLGANWTDHYHKLKRTEWEPWELYLMRLSRCKIVAARDNLTARGLRRKGIKAVAVGNPMMDGFSHEGFKLLSKNSRCLILLCGSRMPEAMNNFKRLLNVAEQIGNKYQLTILSAIGSEPSLEQIEGFLQSSGYTQAFIADQPLGEDLCFQKGQITIAIGVGKFNEWSRYGEIGMANAGTATEQLVGMGVPCVSLPGKGPQFKLGFAMRQSRLLGGSVIPCKDSRKMAQVADLLLRDSQLRNSLSLVGKKRMGRPGGSEALAKLILKNLA